MEIPSLKHIVFLLVFALYSLLGHAAPANEWKPEKFIEFIVPTGSGSGVDATTRTVQHILQSNKLITQAIAVT